MSLAWREVVLPVPRWLGYVVTIDGALPQPASATEHRLALVRRASAGDQDAFEGLVRSLGDRLLATARKILRDPDAAEDAVQQAVISAWRMLPRLRDPARFDGWLYKILVSACYQEARRARRFSGRVQHIAAEPAAEDDAEQWLEREAIEQAFRTLSPAHRAVVVLHHFADLPLTEVACIVGVSPGTARSRLHYALRMLRAALEAADRPVISELQR